MLAVTVASTASDFVTMGTAESPRIIPKCFLQVAGNTAHTRCSFKTGCYQASGWNPLFIGLVKKQALWFGWELSPTGSRVWTVGLQLVALFGKAVEL